MQRKAKERKQCRIRSDGQAARSKQCGTSNTEQGNKSRERRASNEEQAMKTKQWRATGGYILLDITIPNNFFRVSAEAS